MANNDHGADASGRRMVLKSGKTGMEKQEKKQQRHQRQFHDAALETASRVRRLLSQDHLDVAARDRYGDTPLHWACGFNPHPDTVRVLIDAGADVNARGWHDRTPLHTACVDGRSVLVRLLIDAGADVNAQDKDGWTPLDRALNRTTGDTREEILGLFLEHHPAATLESVLKLPPEDPLREETLDWYREHHSEMVMEAYCTAKQETN